MEDKGAGHVEKCWSWAWGTLWTRRKRLLCGWRDSTWPPLGGSGEPRGAGCWTAGSALWRSELGRTALSDPHSACRVRARWEESCFIKLSLSGCREGGEELVDAQSGWIRQERPHILFTTNLKKNPLYNFTFTGKDHHYKINLYKHWDDALGPCCIW